uniref:Uncharacterized protein n=1 Tax=Sphaerodactylus townsendi TaxID=933632 RepID=A0ACB8FNE1_9SAUR
MGIYPHQGLSRYQVAGETMQWLVPMWNPSTYHPKGFPPPSWAGVQAAEYISQKADPLVLGSVTPCCAKALSAAEPIMLWPFSFQQVVGVIICLGAVGLLCHLSALPLFSAEPVTPFLYVHSLCSIETNVFRNRVK